MPCHAEVHIEEQGFVFADGVQEVCQVREVFITGATAIRLPVISA